GRYSDIPVVFLTGKTDEQSTAKGMRLGAADYVTKPFSIPGLIERIEKLLDPNGGAPAGDRSGAEKPPVAVATAGKPAEPGPEDAEPDPEEEPPPEEDAEKPCVLAIDDSPAMLRLISYALSDTYRVCTLPQPEKLRRFLRTTTPDLFLLDYKMPVMSGMDLIPVIRDFPNHKETPVIFLTSERSAALVEEAAALGVCDVVIKPFEPKALREAMEKHLRKG
ncbi:MAG: response regulator, partial [Oscillospiraceae bacterium]|nr:response regulator [Oscillospiraceae bacterium]